eukprot:TCALIF_07629-PA protein Name:"Protein of unknown function" AED:0.52 eAED:0.52 QI:0/0/0.33/0.33/0.5/0.33/3/35/151
MRRVVETKDQGALFLVPFMLARKQSADDLRERVLLPNETHRSKSEHAKPVLRGPGGRLSNLECGERGGTEGGGGPGGGRIEVQFWMRRLGVIKECCCSLAKGVEENKVIPSVPSDRFEFVLLDCTRRSRTPLVIPILAIKSGAKLSHASPL